MPWKACVLVVANRTADSDELLEALLERSNRAPACFTLLVPATPYGSSGSTGGRPAAERQLAAALERMHAAGLEVEGTVGDSDPLAAIVDAWDPGAFDEIVVSTLPTGASRWLAADLPRRAARCTGAPVAHVVSRPRIAQPVGTSAPPRRRDWTALFRMARRRERQRV